MCVLVPLGASSPSVPHQSSPSLQTRSRRRGWLTGLHDRQRGAAVVMSKRLAGRGVALRGRDLTDRTQRAMPVPLRFKHHPSAALKAVGERESRSVPTPATWDPFSHRLCLGTMRSTACHARVLSINHRQWKRRSRQDYRPLDSSTTWPDRGSAPASAVTTRQSPQPGPLAVALPTPLRPGGRRQAASAKRPGTPLSLFRCRQVTITKPASGGCRSFGGDHSGRR